MSPWAELAALVLRNLSQNNPRKRSKPHVPTPKLEALDAIFNILFFASLKTEEGRPIQFRVFYIDPDRPDPDSPSVIRRDRWRIFP